MIFRSFIRKMSTAHKDVTASVVELLLGRPVGSVKTIKGWVKSVRKMGKVIFIDVNDGSSLDSLQVVYPKNKLNQQVQWGASVNVTGTVQSTPKGQLELHADELNLVGKCDVMDNYPFTPKQEQSYDYYRQFLHFRPNLKYFSSMLRFRNSATMKIHEYFNKNGFIQIHTPIITSGDCEGGGEVFSVRPQSAELIKAMKKEGVPEEHTFFNSPAYLTVSGQLHLEAITRSISKVYTFNPSFRAENSRSRLHLSEFYMVEAEEAFVTDLNCILNRIEDLMKKVTSYLMENHSEEMQFMLQHNHSNVTSHFEMLENLVKKPFTVMTFSEAKNLIKENQNKLKKTVILHPDKLSKEEELLLVEINENNPIFIVNWPKGDKPFYMKELTGDSNLVSGVDLIVANVGELCGGSLREDDYQVLEKKLKDLNLLDSMKWYLELRKFGNVPTGGFGLGFERFLQYLLNVQNIKDTIPFPRSAHSLQL